PRSNLVVLHEPGIARFRAREGTMGTKTRTGGSGVHSIRDIVIAVGLALGCTDNPVQPAPKSYTVGGTVSSLAGSGLVLVNNGEDQLPVPADGPVTFATALATGAAYDVTVLTQPTSPAQTCIVTDGAGTVTTANVTTVAVACYLTEPASP